MIEIDKLWFSWQGKTADPTLKIDALHVKQGEHLFLHGPSGSGKSTLLSLLAGIQVPQQGAITLNNTQLNRLSSSQRDQFRADHIGYIFQSFNLLPYLNPIDNVTIACEFSRLRKQRALSHGDSLTHLAKNLLVQLGLDEQHHHKAVNTLSIGQQQRVAAARAVIGDPEIIIADEPTSALDEANRQAFIELLFAQTDKTGATVVFVSHEQSLAPLFSKVVHLDELQGGADDLA
ncbi:ABC transporter ATP-binding protein [Pseudoalteromonas sp. BDTF-M6]|uniref:ABC transporter ATP-binding protein n=1 Tax=Pseudoalteromonas sp. BDTF-M6 TaxID=2796132 RepID=UPI001BAFA325|nr:ABC transporter ATP-binding protein [Pseudoalteromonas sp. BDTF-M6]MBS3797420.1 ABC transporter ATP-binding protein [Pseudoalteromonas sp. BDTF-M6]